MNPTRKKLWKRRLFLAERLSHVSLDHPEYSKWKQEWENLKKLMKEMEVKENE